jgi:hypothetical protein
MRKKSHQKALREKRENTNLTKDRERVTLLER